MHLFDANELNDISKHTPTMQSFSGAWGGVGDWASNLGGQLRDGASQFAGNVLQQGISRAQGSIDDLWSRLGANSNPDVGNTGTVDTGQTGSGQPALDVDAIAAQQTAQMPSIFDDKKAVMVGAALLLIMLVK